MQDDEAGDGQEQPAGLGANRQPGLLPFAREFLDHIKGGPSMNLRLIFWTVGMACATFLLARGNGASSFAVLFIAPFLGAAIGYGLGGLFAKRAKRKARVEP